MLMPIHAALGSGPPDLDTLYTVRRCHDIDLRRMYRQGQIERDAGGYYIWEVEKEGPSNRPPKVYMEETLQWLEAEMMNRFVRADHVYEQLRTTARQKVRVALFSELMRLDYELLFLLNVYAGKNGHPFLSIRQIRQQLDDKLSMGLVADVLARKSSPLSVMSKMEKLLGRTYTQKEMAGGRKGFVQEYKKTEGWFYTVPYGFNKEKNWKFD
ncbi:hypothetical protein [Alkalicoccus chagannorensis]|uniref:hypothetical protein n=1 Tax=Alkalicoccus chagannorensis TaxID=427072 RepID=UPI0003F892DA|nr:hypothetical protein [Alkalicoccus chagannorensis]